MYLCVCNVPPLKYKMSNYWFTPEYWATCVHAYCLSRWRSLGIKMSVYQYPYFIPNPASAYLSYTRHTVWHIYITGDIGYALTVDSPPALPDRWGTIWLMSWRRRTSRLLTHRAFPTILASTWRTWKWVALSYWWCQCDVSKVEGWNNLIVN